jgi:hypothetical protein
MAQAAIFSKENQAVDASKPITWTTTEENNKNLSHLILKRDRYEILACDQCAKAKRACSVCSTKASTDANSMPDSQNIIQQSIVRVIVVQNWESIRAASAAVRTVRSVGLLHEVVQSQEILLLPLLNAHGLLLLPKQRVRLAAIAFAVWQIEWMQRVGQTENRIVSLLRT